MAKPDVSYSALNNEGRNPFVLHEQRSAAYEQDIEDSDNEEAPPASGIVIHVAPEAGKGESLPDDFPSRCPQAYFIPGTISSRKPVLSTNSGDFQTTMYVSFANFGVENTPYLSNLISESFLLQIVNNPLTRNVMTESCPPYNRIMKKKSELRGL